MKQFASTLSRLRPALLLLLFSLLFSACKKDDTGALRTYKLTGSGNGAQMIPTVSGSGSAMITGTYNARTNVLSYNISSKNLSSPVTASGFYSGKLATNGTLVADASTITTASTERNSFSTMTLTSDQERALLDGTWYYMISTSDHPNGEVRGQVITLE
jgi:hypothetical protein